MIDPLVLSREGAPLIFAHANGYPPQAYRAFLEPFLAEFQLQAVYLRPFWPGSSPDQLVDWRDFRDDYLAFLAARDDHTPGTGKASPDLKVIGMGHSVGAVTTLMAAIHSPSLFRALVLIEPVLFKPWQGWALRLTAPLKLMRRFHPLVRSALRRRTRFADLEAMYQNYREKAIFRGLTDRVLRDYVSGLAEDTQDGSIGLSYSPAWEVKIYETAGVVDWYVWSNLGRVTCPVLVLRGNQTDSLAASTLRRLTGELPNGQGVNLPGAGHLAPLELPGETARIILDFLHNLS